MEDRNFANFHLAGFASHAGIDVFDKLKIGTWLRIEAEPDNQFDSYAVAVYYRENKIGYIPASHNQLIYKLLTNGYANIFEVRINRVAPDELPDSQIGLLVRIAEPKKSRKPRAKAEAPDVPAEVETPVKVKAKRGRKPKIALTEAAEAVEKPAKTAKPKKVRKTRQARKPKATAPTEATAPKKRGRKPKNPPVESAPVAEPISETVPELTE
jgi:hypothetical protein